MTLAVLLMILSLPAPTGPASKLTGVWVLERDKSDLGTPVMPDLVLRVEQADQGLAVWELTATPAGRSVTYRHLNLGATPCGSSLLGICWMDAPSGERWWLAASGDLVIARVASVGAQRVRQRLVLAASRQVVD